MTLESALTHTPRQLKFGTSGRRGLVADLTDLEIYVNVTGELEYLQAAGDIARGDEFFFARDLRPSSDRIARTVQSAIHDAGMVPVNLGSIPTPALMFYAVSRNRGSIMVTGSHIPFDRNGYKLNTSRGELLKNEEGPINEAVARVRYRIYASDFASCLFDANGTFKAGPPELEPVVAAAEADYVARYVNFFGAGSLAGMRLAVYQHSAVGRDLLVRVLRELGADAIPCGRSEEFVPIDTENLEAAQLASIQSAVGQITGRLDAVVSTDGDSDRPLVLAVENGKVRFFGGDLVGMIVAEFLGADAVVVPVTCNDAIDRGNLAAALEPKTRIGSPFVIAGMQAARARGRRAVCGWEANGGFLTGSDIERHGRVLTALPTRDALLPVLSVLFAAKEQGKSISALFDALPRRYSRAALLKNYPRERSRQVVERYSRPGSETELARVFSPARGFGAITKIDVTDGMRVYFENGDVAHFRPSGNADEFRIYAVADSQRRADEIAAMGVAEPDGLLRSL